VGGIWNKRVYKKELKKESNEENKRSLKNERIGTEHRHLDIRSYAFVL
jgi:hypothetical protein